MRIYIFEVEDGLTESYHDGGSAAVIADSEERARELLPAGVEGVKLMESYELADRAYQETVHVFRDAGCC